MVKQKTFKIKNDTSKTDFLLSTGSFSQTSKVEVIFCESSRLKTVSHILQKAPSYMFDRVHAEVIEVIRFNALQKQLDRPF